MSSAEKLDRGLHGHLGGDLEQVGDQHVQGGAGAVVEVGPVGDVEVLGDVDLHLGDVLPAPDVLEEPVGEAQHVQVLGALLAQEVVDPEHLLLVEHRVHDLVELAEPLGRGAVGLLVDDPGALGEVVLAERPGVVQEVLGGQREVVHQLGLVAQVLARGGHRVEQLAGVLDGEPAAGEAQPGGEVVPRAVVRRRARTPPAHRGRGRRTPRRSAHRDRCRSAASPAAAGRAGRAGRRRAGPSAGRGHRWPRRARRRWVGTCGRSSRSRARCSSRRCSRAGACPAHLHARLGTTMRQLSSHPGEPAGSSSSIPAVDRLGVPGERGGTGLVTVTRVPAPPRREIP